MQVICDIFLMPKFAFRIIFVTTKVLVAYVPCNRNNRHPEHWIIFDSGPNKLLLKTMKAFKTQKYNVNMKGCLEIDIYNI